MCERKRRVDCRQRRPEGDTDFLNAPEWSADYADFRRLLLRADDDGLSQ